MAPNPVMRMSGAQGNRSMNALNSKELVKNPICDIRIDKVTSDDLLSERIKTNNQREQQTAPVLIISTTYFIFRYTTFYRHKVSKLEVLNIKPKLENMRTQYDIERVEKRHR